MRKSVKCGSQKFNGQAVELVDSTAILNDRLVEMVYDIADGVVEKTTFRFKNGAHGDTRVNPRGYESHVAHALLRVNGEIKIKQDECKRTNRI